MEFILKYFKDNQPCIDLYWSKVGQGHTIDPLGYVW